MSLRESLRTLPNGFMAMADAAQDAAAGLLTRGASVDPLELRKIFAEVDDEMQSASVDPIEFHKIFAEVDDEMRGTAFDLGKLSKIFSGDSDFDLPEDISMYFDDDLFPEFPAELFPVESEVEAMNAFASPEVTQFLKEIADEKLNIYTQVKDAYDSVLGRVTDLVIDTSIEYFTSQLYAFKVDILRSLPQPLQDALFPAFLFNLQNVRITRGLVNSIVTAAHDLTANFILKKYAILESTCDLQQDPANKNRCINTVEIYRNKTVTINDRNADTVLDTTDVIFFKTFVLLLKKFKIP